MNIILACPAPKGSLAGNRVTAERWARLLRETGHRARIVDGWDGQPCDLLVALHATRSYPSLRRWLDLRGSSPFILAITGTDLYRDLPGGGVPGMIAQRTIAWARRIVVLHPLATQALPAKDQAKAVVIRQSVEPVERRPKRSEKTFDVCVLGHLRGVKDPLRTAYALRRLRGLPPLRVVQAGEATSEAWAKRARAAMAEDARYRWVGPLSRGRALRLLARSRLMVISSRMEGGANVVGEATVNDVPILASRVPGNLGLLDAAHPGTFPVADTRALADLIARAVEDDAFLQNLQDCGARCKPWFERERERSSWERLIAEFAG